MTKARMYRVLIAVAETVNQAMDIMQIASTDTAVTSEEFFDIYTDCKARMNVINRTPKTLKA